MHRMRPITLQCRWDRRSNLSRVYDRAVVSAMYTTDAYSALHWRPHINILLHISCIQICELYNALHAVPAAQF